METVVKHILSALQRNGFPEKRVRLPFQPIFKSCKNQGTTLSAVLNELKSTDILHEIDNDRILFFHKTNPPLQKENTGSSTPSSDQEIPEELYAEAMEKIKNMDPKEVERIREQVMNMSPEERDNMMKQANELFQKTRK